MRTSDAPRQHPEDLPGLGVPAELRLLEDGGAVDCHLKPPATRGSQFNLGIRVFCTNLRRQTGGARFVLSDDAVFDGNVHP
jgi:hypothetical protein